jgi:hypothetical protein
MNSASHQVQRRCSLRRDALAAGAADPLPQNFFRLHPRDLAISHHGSPHRLQVKLSRQGRRALRQASREGGDNFEKLSLRGGKGSEKSSPERGERF